MKSKTILLNEQQCLFLLENMIRKKLDDDEIDVGISTKKGRLFSLISLDDYDQGSINLHLYCSAKQEFSLDVRTIDDEGDSQSQVLLLSSENTLVIPEGLRQIMLEAAANEKGSVFRSGQIKD